MNAKDLVIGQKYIWERNSSVSHEVTFLGSDDIGKFTMYTFEYIKECGKMHTSLSVHHVYSDISELPSLKSGYLKKVIDVKYFNHFDAIKRDDQKEVHVLAVTDYYGLKVSDFYNQYKTYKANPEKTLRDEKE